MRLSLLVCGLASRLNLRTTLLAELERQRLAVAPLAAEVRVLTDEGQMILGDKRNQMVRESTGEYVAFIDDDDWIAPDYLECILRLLYCQPDVVTFPVEVTLDDGPPKPCYYSIRFPDQGECETHYWRWPNHLCVIRRELVLKHPFPSIRFGEDTEFAKLIRPALKNQLTFAHHPLYYYRYHSEK